ncbi:MAG TPA: phosphate-starvation-inducible PsiE family protein [Thermomicrobiaceae bacterium]|nr:phosphate-starvation-inducible PsiE family protein [Thermomicrobiaceae bacterium]
MTSPVDAARRFGVALADHAQDILVFALVIVLLALAARALIDLSHLILASSLDVRGSIAEVLYLLVIVELIEILIVYLREHRVAVDFMVEVAIVSILREIVGHGVVDFHWEQLLATAALLLVLGMLVRYGEFRAHHGFGAGRRVPGEGPERPEPPSGTTT